MAWWRRGGSDPAPSRVAAGGARRRAPAPVQRAAWEDLPPIRARADGDRTGGPAGLVHQFAGDGAQPQLPGPAGAPGRSGRAERAGRRPGQSGCPADDVGWSRADRSRPGRPRRGARRWPRSCNAPSRPGCGSPSLTRRRPRARPPSCRPLPAPDQLSAEEPSLGSRHLEPVAVPAPRSLTSAPDPGELSTLPVVSSPSAPAVSSSTVSCGSDGLPARVVRAVERARPPRPPSRTDDAGGRGTDESPAAVQRSAWTGPSSSVPLSSAVRPSMRHQRRRSRLRRRRSRARWSLRCSVTPCRTRSGGHRSAESASRGDVRRPRSRWTSSSHCR